MDYNKTINLPKTDFPMRAGLPAREPGMLEGWEKLDLYHELLKKNEGKPLFSLHDGPPFSNGNLHMGHALNKSIKDFMVRAAAMRGRYTPYIPGWDNHGMPIESAIIKEQKLNRKQMSVPEFRTACHDYAQKYVDIQREGFKRLGVVGDWENPYLTMDPGFEAEEVKVFGEMYKKGYIYKGLKPVYWCPKDETALAEAEIEYQDDPCTTVYVKFQVRDDLGKLSQYGDLSKMYFVIWTTTIWTLPGNLAIAVHPRESYVLVKADNGEMYIMAEALCAKVMKIGGFENYEIVKQFKGADFEYMLAQHPFLDKTSQLCTAEYVTMDSGTGCVHTAPGFGADDYETCKRYKIEMVVPVDDRGRHTDYAGKYAGMKTEESNPVILADMKESGALFASEDIVHSYPHCWRCKNPIIFRATPQWFCSVDAFKEQAVAACDDVRWIPGWGIDRMKSMIRERADWCISRQRRWGLPIPVFYCQDCGKPICNDDTISAVSKLFGEKGSNAWYEMEAADILPAGFSCPHCGSKAGFTKEEDTLDGWFDSGSTHYASMKKDQGFWPATVYMEGLDQYRGWFQSSLLTAVGALGQGAPFKECVTHGWTVDGEGKAMHKSLGNGVDPADIFKKYGADLIRLWAGSADYHVDVRCSDNIFKQLSQNYLKFRNTARYCLGNLDGFDPNCLVQPGEMLELDRWAVTKLNQLIEKCFAAYDEYEFHVVSHAINDFCVVELSSFYLDIIKDRLYCEGKDSLERRSAQTALFLILDTMTKLFAPILAFTCDEIWLAMPHRAEDDGRNVLLNEMNKPFADYTLTQEQMAQWDKIIAVRDAVNVALEAARNEKKIGKSLEADVALTVPSEDAFLAEMDSALLADLFIVSQVEITVGGELAVSVSEAAGQKCERCWKHHPLVGADMAHPTLCPRCAGVIAKSTSFEAL
ncbi:isoleucine--tRNA ligase [Muriventricola aceti]|uniref:isoleucine--tRNA ligase n=1 Tax=Muriventricola aceti TaxID=2981773 RepID=UPI00082133DE|nr:isoleucine--tRNA ligase [Muriventricola aceti]MCU6702345.1 isoleucine--tRNA ligase [Muriventricola aceti]SCJ00881.1 Isoleucine--tRNA ligase [uncultured Flavonifractor sp.]